MVWEQQGDMPSTAYPTDDGAKTSGPSTSSRVLRRWSPSTPLFHYLFTFLNYPCSCWFSVTAGLRHSFPCLHSLLLLSSSLSVLLPGLPPPHLWRRLFQGFTRVSCDGHRTQGGGLMLPHPTGHGPLCPAWPDLAGLCWEQVPPESFPAISPISKLSCTCAGTARASRAAEGCTELGWGEKQALV